ncbi:MAG TPA: hypothetical protein VMZ90_06660 [Vicinamibacterales bacterium]|nr:hypothetical protein [Vicinamibacterales bacterium]
MAKIIVTSHVVRFPLGGLLSWALQWVLGFHRLGHDVCFVEKPGWKRSCYNPIDGTVSDDGSYGAGVAGAMFERYGLRDRWCYVDAQNRYYGMQQPEVKSWFRSADVFIDMSADSFGDRSLTWTDEAADARIRVFIDSEPGYFQARMQAAEAQGRALPEYDHYYTVGLNVGTPGCSVPTAGRQWRGIVDPVVPEIFPVSPPPPDGPFTTVMSWQAHDERKFVVSGYGQKDLEFMKFIDLPAQSHERMEVALGGKNAPLDLLQRSGWSVRDAQEVTLSLDRFYDYIAASKGEFTACKNVFVATKSGFFSERSAAYLASARPVVTQDTGFSAHFPCGEGLFAVTTVEEAAAAIEQIAGDYSRHSRAARRMAEEFFNARKVCQRLLDDIGV